MINRAVMAAVLMVQLACSGSPSKTKTGPGDKPTADPVAAGASLVEDGNAKLKLGGADNQRAAGELFRAACEQKHGEGCTAVAYLVRDGYTAEPVAAAYEWFKKGCELGDAGACGAAGAHLVLNDERDKGLDLLRRSCKEGNGRGCMILSGLLPEGAEAKSAIERSLSLLGEGCKTTGRYCGHLGDAHRSGIGVTADLPAAFGYYKKACELDDGRSCVVLAQFFIGGAGGVEPSIPSAKEALAKSCSLGHGDGCTFGGMLLMSEDRAKGATKFKEGCELGSGRGCVLFAGHSGLEAGLARQELFRRGCQLRYPPGCLLAGTGYLQGVGTEVPADAEKALAHFESGCVELRPVCEDAVCRDGVRDSCHNAGTMFAIGMGTKADRAKAKERYGVACALGGNEEACHNAKD